jgi:hypothetical protein
MILRRLYTILRNGLNAFAVNPALYDTLLIDFLGMEAKEAAAIKATLARAPVRLQHGYPHADIQMPCIAIILQAESISQKFIGDRAFLPLGGMGAGSQYEISAQLLIYSENIDLTAALYELVRAILICSHDELARQGIQSPSYTGTDIAPDPSKIPENLFLRSLGIRAMYAYVLPELLQNQVRGTLFSGLFMPPGTDRSPEAYDSGVTVTAPTSSPKGP